MELVAVASLRSIPAVVFLVTALAAVATAWASTLIPSVSKATAAMALAVELCAQGQVGFLHGVRL